MCLDALYMNAHANVVGYNSLQLGRVQIQYFVGLSIMLER